MVEPTDIEETLDAACDAIIAIPERAKTDPAAVRSPHHTHRRPDEVGRRPQPQAAL